MKHAPLIFGLLLLGAVAPVPAAEFEYKLKGTLAGVSDSGRDFGIPDEFGNTHDDNHRGYVNFTPFMHLQAGDWGFFLRGEAYAQTGPVLRAGNETNAAADPELDIDEEQEDWYFALKEAWIEYGGLTSYPGEWLRLGRQRVRQEDGQWWDTDIDAARWVLDTTQIYFEMGGARQFASYRTDDPEVRRQQRDRSYAFAQLGGEWTARNRITARMTYAGDDNDPLPAIGTELRPDDKRTRGDLVWVGLNAHNHYFDWRRPPHFGYFMQATGLGGSSKRILLDPETEVPTVLGQDKDKVRAYAGEVLGKFVLPRRYPLQFGGGYVHSSGGGGQNSNRQFFQTGVHSNYSRFTGTRTLIHRFNEAYRAQLGNLNVVSAFMSIDHGHYDASAIYHEMWRSRRNAPVDADGVLVRPTEPYKTLGRGFDLILTRYFVIGPEIEEDQVGEATASAIRVRGSYFMPGAAYGDDAKDEYRAMLELVLWY
jgi:alginate production protein